MDIEDKEYEQDLPSVDPQQDGELPRWEFKPRRNPKWGTVEREGLIIGRGVTRKVVPPDEVYKLAALGCTIEEICDWFQVNRETLKYNFSDYIEKGRAQLKQRLRTAQLHVALSGNATMLIWLGKNILGQTDTPTNSDNNQPLPWTDDTVGPGAQDGE